MFTAWSERVSCPHHNQTQVFHQIEGIEGSKKIELREKKR